MSSQLFAILTVLVIGIVSFLIGKYLTSSKWKKKYLEANTQNRLLEIRNGSVKDALKESKEKEDGLRKKNKELLDVNKSNQETIKDLGIQNSKKSKTITHTDESYNEIQNALNAEKKKVIALEAQLAKNIAPKKRVSTSTFKSFENDKLGTKKILHTKPQYNGLLATVLNRMSMFNNQDEIDDLTKIDGINSAISDILKKEGLQNYKQIAMLEKEDFSLIAKVTGVSPTRILEHNWVGIARDLYHQKYKVDL